MEVVFSPLQFINNQRDERKYTWPDGLMEEIFRTNCRHENHLRKIPKAEIFMKSVDSDPLNNSDPIDMKFALSCSRQLMFMNMSPVIVVSGISLQ